MKTLVALIFSLLCLSNANAYQDGSILVGGQFGFLFSSPTAYNNYIATIQQQAGLQPLKMATADSWNGHIGYAIDKQWSILANYSHFSPQNSLTVGNNELKAQTETNLFMAEGKYSMFPENQVHLYFELGVGYGSYSITESENASTTTGSAGSIAVKGAIGGELIFNDVFSLSVEGGYLFAKSGTLTDQITGATFNPNQLDMSGPFVLVGFDFAIPTSK